MVAIIYYFIIIIELVFVEFNFIVKFTMFIAFKLIVKFTTLKKVDIKVIMKFIA